LPPQNQRLLRTDASSISKNKSPKKLPKHIPFNYDQEKFGGNYHTDILIPKFVTSYTSGLKTDIEWQYVYFDFYDTQEVDFRDPNFGQWRGVPVPDEAIYFNPWRPEKPLNQPLIESRFWSKVLPMIAAK
jgi:hypothetical protein